MADNNDMEVVIDETQDIKAALQGVIRGMEPPTFSGGKANRGIVICAGGTRYFTNAWVAIKLLRFHGCDLPIELWAIDVHEIDGKMCGLVESLGVEVCYAGDAFSSIDKETVQGRWQWALKPHAIVHSAFDEVLYLDADNFPVRDPSDLFECEAYRAEGNLFWPDIRMAAEDNRIWEVMDVPYRTEPEFETGQILIDKRRCWEPLQLALWMNMHSDTFYDLIWGDKDTFRFAWHKFGRLAGMVPHPAQVLGMPGDPYNNSTMCQHDFEGNWLFQHRNMAKWNLLADNPRIPGFLFEHECRGFLAELRERWNGRVGEGREDEEVPESIRGEFEDVRRDLQAGFWLLEDRRPRPRKCCGPIAEWSDLREPFPWRDPREGAPGQEIADRIPMEDTLSVAGFRCNELTFLPDSIGRGVNSEFCWWKLKPGLGGIGLALELQGEEEVSCSQLKLSRDGSWRGWAEGRDGVSYPLRLMRLETLYPEQAEAEPLNGDRPAQPVHVANYAFGVGDAITGIYAAAGLVKAGAAVVYHTRHPGWLSRVDVPGLTITEEEPPEGTVDLNADYAEQIRYAGDKARWYSMLAAAALPSNNDSGIAAPPFAPGRPRLDLAVPEAVLDMGRYVLLAPFSATPMRDWPESHWGRLAYLLGEVGYEVVAIGVKTDEKRFQKTFEHSYAYWVVDQSPEWVMAAMLGAECMVGLDSGMIHLAGLLGVPAVCIHSHLPPSFLFGQTPSVFSAAPRTQCVFCRWREDAGYNDSCAESCAAIAGVSPEHVLEIVQSGEVAKVRSGIRRQVAEDTERAEEEADRSAASRFEVVGNKVDVIAYTERPNCGLGEAAEANIKAMRSLGLTVEQRFWQRDLAIEPALRDPGQIYYHHWHPQAQDPFDMWRHYIPESGAGARHIAYWAYEIDGELPETFQMVAPIMTEIWTPSTFCKRLFEQTGIPVSVLPHTVPSIDTVDELPSTGGKAPYTVLTLFDAWSRFGRKNPQAVIRVFQQAFPDRMDVRLVLKGRHLTERQLQRLKSDCGWDSRINVVNQFLSESDRDRLFTSADVYLGLQRSEGFGLNLARCLGMGLPLITTGWSGLLDFCKEDHCFLVPYDLRGVQDADSGFPGDGVWAEPDEDAAAELLTTLAGMTARDDSRLNRMRQDGRDFVRNHLGEEVLRENLRSLLDKFGVITDR